MHRKRSAAVDRSDSPTEPIARISAELGSPTEATGRHRRPVTMAGVGLGLSGRPLSRRLAPLAVGAAVMLVATTVVTVLRPAEDSAFAAPELSATQSITDPTVRRLGPVTPTQTPNQATPSATAEAARVPAPRTGTAPTTTRRSAPAAAAPARRPGPPASGGDGTQAAAAQGWTLVGGDEFNGSKSAQWSAYQGAGHAGKGRRTASAITVENGSLVIRGDSSGTTGGMAWRENQRFGKWEMRAKFPRGDRQYHPVLLLWPNGSWPSGGEIDFAETTSASTEVSFFLHYSSSNKQKYAKKSLDLTQWHNYAVEWVDGRITGYIDGQKWFESTDRATMPPDKMHAAIQLDYFPSGGSPQPTEIYVDYMRIYR